MKKILSRLIVPLILLVTLGAFFTVYAVTEETLPYPHDCPSCQNIADVDQNGVVDSDDAILVLFYANFPERYTMPGCPAHGNSSAPSTTSPGESPETPGIAPPNTTSGASNDTCAPQPTSGITIPPTPTKEPNTTATPEQDTGEAPDLEMPLLPEF